MSTVVDYIGRTVDLLAFQGVMPSPREQLLTSALVDAKGYSYVVTGVEKLAQRALMILLTAKGSVIYQPLLGTTFMIDAEQGAWQIPNDVQLSYNLARLDLVRQLQAMQLATDPLDEQIANLLVISIGLAAGSVTLWLQLTNQAGNSYTFIAPIPIGNV